MEQVPDEKEIEREADELIRQYGPTPVERFKSKVFYTSLAIAMGLFGFLGSAIPLVIYLLLRHYKPAFYLAIPDFFWGMATLYGIIHLMYFFSRFTVQLVIRFSTYWNGRKQSK